MKLFVYNGHDTKRIVYRFSCTAWLIGLFLNSTLSISHASCAPSVPHAFDQVAHEYAIPSDVFYAIALQESGRYTERYGYGVWPWALNINYTTHYPESYAEAVELIEKTRATGSEWIAVGMMQIYWKYHKQRFDENPYYALDIATNLRLGAQIFSEALTHHDGDVWKAVGFYYAGVITSEREQREVDTYISGVQTKHKTYVMGGCDEIRLATHD